MSTGGPRVWALLSYRAGESSQILGLAEALRELSGIDFEEKRIHPRPWRFAISLARLPSSCGVDRRRSSPIAEPWPDLLISAGAKNEPVARWIKARSGGRTKLVFLGRTWCPPETFDLVVTTPQYRLPEHPQILHNPVTITRIGPERLAEARRSWTDRLGVLPEPRLAVLVGGRSGGWCFGRHAARRLAADLETERARLGGSIMVTTSSRTDPAAAELLDRLIAEPKVVHLWHRDRREDNPYFGFLALAEEIVVTGDSIAMLSEALATGLPVRAFDLGTGKLAMRRRGAATGPCDQTVATRAYRLMCALGPRRLGRDLRLAHDRMLETRQLKWLGDEDYPETCIAIDARRDTALRVLALLHGVEG